MKAPASPLPVRVVVRRAGKTWRAGAFIGVQGFELAHADDGHAEQYVRFVARMFAVAMRKTGAKVIVVRKVEVM